MRGPTKKKHKPKCVSLIISDESTEGTISLEELKRLDRRFRDAKEGETVTICNSY